MAITSLTGVQTAVKQSLNLVVGGLTAGLPRLRLFNSVAKIPAQLNVSNPSNASGVQFTNPAPGMNTYISDVQFVNLGTAPGFFIIIDVVFGYTLSNVTTLQTLTPQSMGARDINGTTRGDGVYLLLATGESNLSSSASVLTATYTSSDGNTGRTGATPSFLNLAGNEARFLRIENGDVGVRSVQSVQFSAAPGGTTYLLGYRPIALVVSPSDLRNSSSGDSISLGLPRVYDNSCIQVMYAGTGGSTGPMSFIQG